MNGYGPKGGRLVVWIVVAEIYIHMLNLESLNLTFYGKNKSIDEEYHFIYIYLYMFKCD